MTSTNTTKQKEHWQTEKLGNVITIEGGTQPPASEFSKTELPGYVRLVQIRDFDSDKYKTYIKDSPKWRKLSKDDVMIARYGASLGRILKGLEGAYNVALAKAIPDETKLDKEYLYYFLKTDYFYNAINGMGQRAVQAGFNKSDLQNIYIPLPPINTQKSIAKVLGELDKKIELNKNFNVAAEEIGNALFKKFFVDNEAKDAWGTGKISDFCTLSKETRQPQKEKDIVFSHYSIPAYDNGFLPELTTGAEIKSNKYIVPENCILVSKLNPVTPRVWAIIEPGQEPICSTEFVCLVPESNKYSFLYYLLKSKVYQDTMIAAAGGTSNSHKRVSPDYITSYEFKIPPEELIAKFEEATKGLLLTSDKNIQENTCLAQARDILLPRLLSGEISL